MFCNNCGTANADSARFCVNCGNSMVAATVVVNPASVMGGAPAQAAQPAVLPQPQSQWPGPQAQPPKTSGKALAALILGIVNALLLFLCFPIAILAVVFGHLGRSEVKRSNGQLGGAGMAMTGLVLGYVSVLAVPFILIIAAIAIPGLLSARKSANEASALGSLRTINTACVTYYATYPDKGYPPYLTSLGPPPAGGSESADAAGYIDQALASGVKNGYVFLYAPGSVDENGLVAGYTVTATPLQPGQSGERGFFTDETGVIRADSSGSPSANSPPVE